MLYVESTKLIIPSMPGTFVCCKNGNRGLKNRYQSINNKLSTYPMTSI